MEELMYPIGMQNFPEIREKGFVYVDKTQYIELLGKKGKYFFLGRPRRFGKSLFLSTLQAYFEGKRHLFEGLAISRSNASWVPAPVLHIDFTGMNFVQAGSLDNAIDDVLKAWERAYGISDIATAPELRFRNVISAAYELTGKKVAILIDEYDKPLLDTIEYPELQESNRNALRGLYGNLKQMDAYIQFAMLTGVTRFGKLSIFSDLNNLNDISLDEDFAGICGITTDELHEYFAAGVEKLSAKLGMGIDEAYAELKSNYDGYHFSTNLSSDVYNPYSLLCALSKSDINSYWFETGTPSFLVKLIKSRKISLGSIDEKRVPIDSVSSVSLDLKSTLYPVMYQSGYLTIKGYDRRTRMLRLGYPNMEVERGFLLQLMNLYLGNPDGNSWSDIVNFYKDVVEGNAENFMQRLQSLYANFNSDAFSLIDLEQHYQDIAYLVFSLMGCLTDVEYKTATGRIDMVVRTADFIYIFEFKRNSSPQKALEQINERNYALPFKADGRRLVKIGANFSDEQKGLSGWIIQTD